MSCSEESEQLKLTTLNYSTADSGNFRHRKIIIIDVWKLCSAFSAELEFIRKLCSTFGANLIALHLVKLKTHLLDPVFSLVNIFA